MVRRPLDSPLSIVMLGLLAEHPQHPYGMRTLMRERGHDRIVARGAASLYDTMGRLAAAGLVEAQESRQEGRRPERTIYRLTATGLASLQGWVRDALSDPNRANQFTAALSFMYVLPQGEVVDLLTRRAVALDEQLNESEAALTDAVKTGVPPIFLSEGRYSHTLLEAERAWLTTFTNQLSSGALRWPTHDSEQP